MLDNIPAEQVEACLRDFKNHLDGYRWFSHSQLLIRHAAVFAALGKQAGAMEPAKSECEEALAELAALKARPDSERQYKFCPRCEAVVYDVPDNKAPAKDAVEWVYLLADAVANRAFGDTPHNSAGVFQIVTPHPDTLRLRELGSTPRPNAETLRKAREASRSFRDSLSPGPFVTPNCDAIDAALNAMEDMAAKQERRDCAIICHNCSKSYMFSASDETNRCPECRSAMPAKQEQVIVEDCGHIAYRNHKDRCIVSDCRNAAYITLPEQRTAAQQAVVEASGEHEISTCESALRSTILAVESLQEQIDELRRAK